MANNGQTLFSVLTKTEIFSMSFELGLEVEGLGRGAYSKIVPVKYMGQVFYGGLSQVIQAESEEMSLACLRHISTFSHFAVFTSIISPLLSHSLLCSFPLSCFALLVVDHC